MNCLSREIRSWLWIGYSILQVHMTVGLLLMQFYDPSEFRVHNLPGISKSLHSGKSGEELLILDAIAVADLRFSPSSCMACMTLSDVYGYAVKLFQEPES